MLHRLALVLIATLGGAMSMARAATIDPTPGQADIDRCDKSVRDDITACDSILKCATTYARAPFCTKLPRSRLSDMFVNRGAAYYYKGDYAHSIDDNNQAVALDATNYVAHVGLGHAYRDTGDLDRALTNFNEAVRLNPGHASNYHARGLVYLDKLDYDHAIADFSRAIELDPAAIKPYANRGVAYRGKGDFAHAQADFEKALALTVNSDNDRRGQDSARADLAELKATLAKSAPPPPSLPPSPPIVSLLTPPLIVPGPVISPTPHPPTVSPPQQAATAPAEKRVALVIGNAAYQNVRRLDNPANDAHLMADTLRALGFTLVGGGPQLDLDKISLDHMAQTFGQQLRGADVGLLYYAGHGVQIDGENYLVPVNANPTSKADVDFQMTNVQLLVRQMELSGTRLNLVILDACRNNPFGGRGLRDAGSGLAQMHAPRGTLIGFATAPNTAALDGIEGNSPYAKALAASMRRPGLGLFDTFNTVAVAVQRSTGGAQEPWFATSPIEGDPFYFAPIGKAAGQ
jgi:tetratricopeptide (TPR) repeat protein